MGLQPGRLVLLLRGADPTRPNGIDVDQQAPASQDIAIAGRGLPSDGSDAIRRPGQQGRVDLVSDYIDAFGLRRKVQAASTSASISS